MVNPLLSKFSPCFFQVTLVPPNLRFLVNRTHPVQSLSSWRSQILIIMLKMHQHVFINSHELFFFNSIVLELFYCILNIVLVLAHLVHSRKILVRLQLGFGSTVLYDLSHFVFLFLEHFFWLLLIFFVLLTFFVQIRFNLEAHEFELSLILFSILRRLKR